MDHNAETERGPAAGTGSAVGSFRLFFTDQRWEWSDDVAAMHGYAPGQVVPTTELLLAHKHPEDKTTVAETLERVLQTGEPFSSNHRIIDTRKRVHHVIVVGDRMLDKSTGAVIGTEGFYIDVSNTHREDMRTALDETIPDLIRTRAEIEQAKGALMLIYGISAERAFDVLTWRSQQTNTKIRVLARELLDAVRTDLPIPDTVRSSFDRLLLGLPSPSSAHRSPTGDTRPPTDSRKTNRT
jgi:hypothetical protein